MNEFAYKVFVRLLDTWPFNKLLLWKFKADSEFEIVSHFASHNWRVPLFVPTFTPFPEVRFFEVLRNYIF